MKSKTDESKRRKANCIECSNFKPIKAKDMCQNCWHKVKRKYHKNFFVSTRYTELKQRCINPNNTDGRYFNKKYCTKEEFINFSMNCPKLSQMYKNWQDSGFEYTLCPSIDRIDKQRGYEIDNIQWLEHGKNCSKDNESKIKVEIYTKNGQFVGVYDALNEACVKLDIIQANAWKVLHGERKTANGYIIKRCES